MEAASELRQRSNAVLMKAESTRIESVYRLTFLGAGGVNFTPFVPVV